MIEKYRDLYSADLAECLSNDNETLPASLEIPVLLNPLFGSKERIIGSGFMPETQYNKAQQDLLEKMQDILDRKNPIVATITVDSSNSSSCGSDSKGETSKNSSSSSSSSEDEETPTIVNSNHAIAKEQFQRYMTWHQKKFLPEMDKVKSQTIYGGGKGNNKGKKMRIGPVLKKGKDLPSGKNIADYIDKLGRMDVVTFAENHKDEFGIIWLVVQCEASRCVVEVGCERFLNLSGYVSSAKRTRLGVRNYERLAMLASTVQNVYVDVEWVAKEYLTRTKKGA